MMLNDTNLCYGLSTEIAQMWAPFSESLNIRYFGYEIYNLCDGRYGFLTSAPSVPTYYVNELLYPAQEEAFEVLKRYPLYVISSMLNSSIKGLSSKKQQRFIKMAMDFHFCYYLGVVRRESNWMQILGYGIDDMRKDGAEILFRQLTWLKSVNHNIDELIKPYIKRINNYLITLPDYAIDMLKILDYPETNLRYSQLLQLMKRIYQLTDREFECLRLAALGESAKLIARKFNISPRTVEIFIERLKQKFKVPSKIALCEKYFRYFDIMQHKAIEDGH